MNGYKIKNMTHNELHPIIQSWTDSDEFINSLVSVAQEFSLVSTALLIEAIFGLLLKNIRPEEFKSKLLSSLPPDKQSEVIVSKLVSSSLLPIKGPLAESGIDISIITPLDEASIIPYTPPVLETLVEETESEYSITPLDEADIPPSSPALVRTTNLATPESLIISTSEAPVSSQPIFSPPSAPTETIMISESVSTPSSIMPIYPAKPTPSESETISSFSHSLDIPAPPISINESINEPPSISAPFVIHQEKPMERVSQNPQHKEELLRPLFYSKEEEKQESPSFVNLEFKPPITNDKTSLQDT